MTKRTIHLTIIALPLLFAFTVLNTGCQGEKNGGNRVGLVDLEKILEELELDSEFNEKIEEKQESLRSEIQEQRGRYEDMMRTRQEKLSEDISETDINELTEFESRVNRQLQELIQRSQQELNEYQQELINNLKKRLKPLIEDLAREQDLDVIIQRRNTYFVINEELDITNDLIERIEQNPEDRESLSPEN